MEREGYEVRIKRSKINSILRIYIGVRGRD